MQNAFNAILVPIDFTDNTKVAIKKATDLAAQDSVIHLLHVQTSGFFRIGHFTSRRSNALAGNSPESLLINLKANIQRSFPGLAVCTWTSFGNNLQKCIESKAKSLSVDLIIIAKNSQHSWLPFLNSVSPSQIASKTGVSVLTIKPGCAHCETRKIVVPVTGAALSRKMELIKILHHKYRVKVYLVTFMSEDKPSEFYASTILQMFQWLKASVHCPVEYVVLHGRNKAKETLLFAEKISADVLLVYPEIETRVGWPGRHISDVLDPQSRVQVFAVNQST